MAIRNIQSRIITILLLLFTITGLYAQPQRCGRLVSYYGQPLKDATVTVRGTSRTTTTDKNGNFCINVFAGEVIEYNRDKSSRYDIKSETVYFIDDSTAVPTRYSDFLKKYFNTDKRFKTAIGVLNKNSPTWSSTKSETDNWNGNIYNTFGEELVVRNIGSIYYNLSGTKAVVAPTPYIMVPDTKLSFETNFSVVHANRLPGYQQPYSQGRSQNGELTYRGPGTNELFSWGPVLSNLEYDGVPTPYSSYGSIVPQGQGNGTPVKLSDPYSFFRTAIAARNILNVYTPLLRGVLQFNYTNQYSNGIMSKTTTNTNNFLANWKRNALYKWDVAAFYRNTVTHFPERGANMATLMYDISTTPPTFDNANGMSTKEAASNSLSYNVNNTERQYAGTADNPYRFINNRQDKFSRYETGGKLEVSRNVKDLILTLHTDYTYYNANENNGMQPYTPIVMQGWQSLEKNNSLSSSFEAKYAIKNDFYHSSFAYIIVPREASLKFLNDYTNTNFNITGKDYTQSSVANNGTGYNRKYDRDANNISLSVNNISYDGNNKLKYRFTANTYNSNTLAGKQLYIMPSLYLGGDFYRPLRIDFINFLGLSVEYNKSITEAPLYYPNRYFGSTTMPSQNFRQYNEFENYSFANGLKPECSGIWDFSANIDLRLKGTYLYITPGYYYGNIKDFVAITNVQDKFVMQNSGNYRKQGFEVKLEAGNRYWRSRFINNWRAWFVFNNPTLKATSVNGDMVRIAGFNDVAIVAKKGEAFGAIYGTRWMRNAAGQRIIGSDGYPLPDTVQGIIGNATPKYIMRLGNSIAIRKINLEYTLEYKCGGQMWNGTHATMNYFGTSVQSAIQRNTTNYIFDGVQQDGSKNNIPVSFYNPAEDISKNYFVRYGSSGVAEEAMQDASWVRLQHVAITHSFSFRNKGNHSTRSYIKFGWWLDNVLLWTPYSGVDPQTSLFGYSSGRGLDYFNMPATWSTGISASITIK